MASTSTAAAAAAECSSSAVEDVKKTVKLRSSDGEVFEVEERVAMLSQTIKHMVEDDCAGSVIPLPNVSSKILAKVIEYCTKHVDDVMFQYPLNTDKVMADWDAKFIDCDLTTILELVLAANYLDTKGLFDFTCKTVAKMMEGKSAEEIRKIFNIKNDYTPEEEEELRKQNSWAFE